ncbi:MAG: lamin tail domain-containing protein [Candidatus Wolfebacteria bacterium]|nr:lamin tail domain-containing protein [Candidatus Wolfebacteria bacterium]
MVIISEFLPNPAGLDADGEFIELYNNGAGATDLSGWKLKDAANKTFKFPAGFNIGADEYISLPYSQTKISLNNNGEKLFLFDNQSNLISQAEYAGTAAAGESLIKQGDKFVFTIKPTPGKANIYEIKQAAGSNSQKTEIASVPANASLLASAQGFWPQVFLIDVLLSLILAVFFVIIWRKISAEDNNP